MGSLWGDYRGAVKVGEVLTSSALTVRDSTYVTGFSYARIQSRRRMMMMRRRRMMTVLAWQSLFVTQRSRTSLPSQL